MIPVTVRTAKQDSEITPSRNDQCTGTARPPNERTCHRMPVTRVGRAARAAVPGAAPARETVWCVIALSSRQRAGRWSWGTGGAGHRVEAGPTRVCVCRRTGSGSVDGGAAFKGVEDARADRIRAGDADGVRRTGHLTHPPGTGPLGFGPQLGSWDVAILLGDDE